MSPDPAAAAAAAPETPADAPRATFLDGLVTCPHCSGWIESNPDYAGQVVACPHCGGNFQMHETIEPGFTPAPVHPGGSPPKEPWFYGFIDAYARVWMGFSILAGTLLIGAAAVALFLAASALPRGGTLWIGAFWFATSVAMLIFWLLGILLSVALLHLAVDIARNLRAIRQREPDRGRGLL